MKWPFLAFPRYLKMEIGIKKFWGKQFDYQLYKYYEGLGLHHIFFLGHNLM